MVVPDIHHVAVGLDVVPDDGDEPGAGLEEAAGEEEALAVLVAAVGLAEGRGLVVEVEGLLDAGVGQHPDGLFEEDPRPERRARPSPMAVEGALGVLDPLEEAEAVPEPPAVDPFGEGEAVRRRGLHLAGGFQFEGVEPRAEEPGVRPGVDDAVVPDGPGDRHSGGQPAHRREPWLRRTEPTTGEVGPLAARRGTLVRRGVELAGEGVEDARDVVVARVRERPNDRHLVGVEGHPRQLVADRDAGDGRGDRLELAPDAGEGVGFQVPHVLLGGPRPQVQAGCTTSPCRRSCPSRPKPPGWPRPGGEAGGRRHALWPIRPSRAASDPRRKVVVEIGTGSLLSAALRLLAGRGAA